MTKNETLLPPKVSALCDANEAIRELKVLAAEAPHNATPPLLHNMGAKQTYGETGAGWDVRGVESKGGAPGPDVETAALSLQQHGAVVHSRGLETPAALETWGGRGRDRVRLGLSVSLYSFRCAFCMTSRITAVLNGGLTHSAGASAEWRRLCLTFFCWAPCQRSSLIHVFGHATVPLIIAPFLWEQQRAHNNTGEKNASSVDGLVFQVTPGNN